MFLVLGWGLPRFGPCYGDRRASVKFPVMLARLFRGAAPFRQRVYGNDAPILGQIYQNIVRDWKNENVALRGFTSPISVRNTINDLPDDVIDTLLEVSRKNIGIFHRFFRLKARKLGMDKLRRYDVYAPLAASDKRYTFQQAADLTFEAFDRFDPRFTSLAKRFFN